MSSGLMKNKRFLLLSSLVSVDCILTFIAVGSLGIEEPNPLFDICGGLVCFMLVKMAVSALCLVSIYVLSDSVPVAANAFTIGLCVLYGVAVYGGVLVIVWTVM